MTERFPLLEQLRAERERHEAEIAAPFVWRIDWLTALYRSAREENQAYSTVLTNGIEDRLINAIRGFAADQFAPMVMKALGAKPGEPVTVTVTPDDLRFCMPDQVEQILLSKARKQIGEEVGAIVLDPRRDPLTATEQSQTVIRYHIPPLTVEVPVASSALKHKERIR